MSKPSPRSGVILIGNELLSGRTQDSNLAYIAKKLLDIGVPIGEARIIPDQEKLVIETLQYFSSQFTYVFTTGGIGPTHDDITAACVAKAFNRPLRLNKEARAALLAHYGAEDFLTPARLKMAEIPEGARLIANPVSGAPGFIVENVYVMAGVPKIMQAMCDDIIPLLEERGAPISAQSLLTSLPESEIAPGLQEIQNHYPHIDIGSYPFFHPEKSGVQIVARGTDTQALQTVTKAIFKLLQKMGDKPEISNSDQKIHESH